MADESLIYLTIASSFLAIAILTLAVYYIYSRTSESLKVTRKAAKESLAQIGDWSKWMSGIQTAILGVIGATWKTPTAVNWNTLTAIVAIVFMGAALFCSAWVLSALSTINLTISTIQPEEKETYDEGTFSTSFDIYNQGIYSIVKNIPLGFLTTLQHWIWGIGLVLFAIYLLTMPPDPPKAACCDAYSLPVTDVPRNTNRYTSLVLGNRT